MTLNEIIILKADLICKGIRKNDVVEEIFKMQYPNNLWKTGNVGLFILLNNSHIVQACITHDYNQKSPYTIIKHECQYFLYSKNKPITSISIPKKKKWITSTLRNGKPINQVILHEGSNMLHQVYTGCDLHKNSNGCKFCGAGKTLLFGRPKEIGEAVNIAKRNNIHYQIVLSMGILLPFNKYYKFLIDTITEIRKHSKEIPIWLEIAPPKSLHYIKDLVDAGATSMAFNIEVWNDKRRMKICPGKSNISKPMYLNAMEYSLKLLGKDKVGSALLVGLDDNNSLYDGIDTLTSLGVHPCIIPFKPFNGSDFQNLNTTEPETFIETSNYSVSMMIKNQLNPDMNQGCQLCNSCNIFHEIYRNETKN